METAAVLTPVPPEIKHWFTDHGLDPTPDGRIQVSVYAVDRHYGGPEEGGWYWDSYQFTGVSERVAPGDVEAAKQRLEALFADQQPKYPLNSVLSDGPEFHVVLEERAAGNEQLARPRYE